MRVGSLTGKLGQKTKFDPQGVVCLSKRGPSKKTELNNRGGFSERSDFEPHVKTWVCETKKKKRKKKQSPRRVLWKRCS